ncbi:required for drug-induced death protein 1 [Phaenicophaeus curvirostris]|uniref:required for drug-induced death protein 1 n=1 Tax=Phaenicophaeus curvirostris TaxID=33595 RepID=UPI0037F0EA99
MSPVSSALPPRGGGGSGPTCGRRREPRGTMAVGARPAATVRGRQPRRDDRVCILPGEKEEDEEEKAAAGVRVGAPEEEEGAACRKVCFAVLPGSYEPLRPPPAAKRPYGRRLRKYGKNVSKALRKGCRYLVVGLQGLATAYSAPFGVAAQVASFVR